MSPSRPSKRFVTILTLPLLANILTTLSTSTKLLSISPFTSLPSLNLPKIVLITTILVALFSASQIIYHSRYDRLLLVFIPPLFTAALAMAVLLAMFPIFTDNAAMRHSGVAQWLLVFSAIPVGAGSLIWLVACYGWLIFGEFQPQSALRESHE